MRRVGFDYPDVRHLPAHVWAVIAIVVTVLIGAVVW